MGTSKWTSELGAHGTAGQPCALLPRTTATERHRARWGTGSGRCPSWILLVCLFALFGTSSPSHAWSQTGVGSSGFQWSFEYDHRGRVSSLTDPGRKKTKLTYTEHRHNVLKSVTREHASGAKIKSEFDRAGRRTKLTDAHGVVVYAYDKFGRLQSAQRRGEPKLAYTYDSRDRVRTMRIGSEFQLRYDYDYRGRIRKMTTPVGPILFTYSGSTGTVERRLPNGIRTKWALDEDDKVASISHSSKDNKLLAHYEYTYRLDGLISAITERGTSGPSTISYNYDRVQRLIGVRGGGPKIDYAYDSLGNRLSWAVQGQKPTKASYGWAGQLMKLGGRAIPLDASGNQLQGSDPATSFTFDEQNRMVTAAGRFGRVSYAHDGDGNLLRRSTASGSVRYLPDPLAGTWRPLMIQRAGGETIYLVWDGESPLMSIEGKVVRCYLSDQLGSARLVADRAGTLLDRRDYRPFGTPLTVIGSSDPEPGFAGLFYDPLSGVYLARARAYDPSLGRFMQRDPELRLAFGSQEDLSQYPYCANDPVNFLDRTGGARRPIGFWVMDWSSMHMSMSSMGISDISRDLQRKQQAIQAKQWRMMSDMSRRQQQMRAQQSRMMSRMQSQQLRMRSQQSALMARMQRQQTELRFRQSRMQADAGRMRVKMERMRMDAARVAPSQLQGAIQFRNNVITVWRKTLVTQALNTWSNVITIATTMYGSGLVRAGAGGAMRVAKFAAGAMHSRAARTNDQLRAQGFAGVAAHNDFAMSTYDGLSGLVGKLKSAAGYLGTFRLKTWTRMGGYQFNRRTYQETRLSFDPSNRGDRAMVKPGGYDGIWRMTGSALKADYGKLFKMVTKDAFGQLRGPATAFMEHTVSSFSNFHREKPGGIRLVGSGQALGNMGALDGVAIDKTNGRLVLLGKDQRRGELPPLRLDDIVTIFRSVYIYGEAPSVTIDPISDKKTEEWMEVGHGVGTEFTYVGWVLFEADRIMKCYGLGQDNNTKKKVHSRIPGYRDFNAIGVKSSKQRWERFWIVPSSQARVQGATSDLTMLECPLELMSERMTWDGKQLVTATNPKSSPSATAYTKWFTAHYDGLAKEVRSMPPDGCGVEQPVAVFEELKRIAIITGVAETLRDQNVPMPGWMYDYPVQPCIADPITPMIRIKGSGYEVAGGVRMTASDAKRTSRTGDVAVTKLSRELITRLATAPLFTPVSVTYKGSQVKAVTIPGADTTTSGAMVLQHVDLTNSELLDGGFALTREFNSFYDPRGGIFGRGWTLDLPELKKARKPVSRTDRSVQFRTVWQLTSPLNTWSERFAVAAVVPERNVEMLTSSRSDIFLGVAQGRSPIDGKETMELALREGGSWHFDLEGQLVARVGESGMILYRRNHDHRLESVEYHELRGGAPLSGKPRVLHELGYKEGDRRVQTVKTHAPELPEPAEVHYFYGGDGQLAIVVSKDLSWGYSYQNGLVESVTRAGELVGTYTYDDQGKVVRQALADGRNVGYQRSATSYGSKVVARDTESDEVIETVEYDANSRLIGSTFEDGSRMAWSDTHEGAVTTITLPDGEQVVTTDSLDGQRSTSRTSSGVEEVREYDSNGRLVRAQIEGGLGMRQSWDSHGRVQSVDYDDQTVAPSYTAQGQLLSMTTTPPGQESQRQGEFVQTNYGADGRVVSVVDEAGVQMSIEYDASGEPARVQGPRASMAFDRDAKGRLRKLTTSWGMTEVHDYGSKDEVPNRITIRQASAQGVEEARIEFQQGRVIKVRQPDGAETKVEYFQGSKHEGLLKSIQNAEQLTLSYEYSSGELLDHIDVLPAGKVGSYRVHYMKDKKGRLTGIRHELLKR